jgi:hypothetical protein
MTATSTALRRLNLLPRPARRRRPHCRPHVRSAHRPQVGLRCHRCRPSARRLSPPLGRWSLLQPPPRHPRHGHPKAARATTHPSDVTARPRRPGTAGTTPTTAANVTIPGLPRQADQVTTARTSTATSQHAGGTPDSGCGSGRPDGFSGAVDRSARKSALPRFPPRCGRSDRPRSRPLRPWPPTTESPWPRRCVAVDATNASQPRDGCPALRS